jgi:hypothetical protein
MNDSAAAARFLSELNLPYRSQLVLILKQSKRGAIPKRFESDTSRNADRDS